MSNTGPETDSYVERSDGEEGEGEEEWSEEGSEDGSEEDEDEGGEESSALSGSAEEEEEGEGSEGEEEGEEEGEGSEGSSYTSQEESSLASTTATEARSTVASGSAPASASASLSGVESNSESVPASISEVVVEPSHTLAESESQVSLDYTASLEQQSQEITSSIVDAQPLMSVQPSPDKTASDLAVDTMVSLDLNRKVSSLYIKDKLRTLEGHARDVVEHKHEDEEQRRRESIVEEESSVVTVLGKAGGGKELSEEEAVRRLRKKKKYLDKQKALEEKEAKAKREKAAPEKSGKSPKNVKEGKSSPPEFLKNIFGKPKINLGIVTKAKRIAKKVQKRARGNGVHKTYRCRCEVLWKGELRWCWVVWKNGMLKGMETEKRKFRSNTGKTMYDWWVGGKLFGIDSLKLETNVTIIPHKFAKYGCKVVNSRGCAHLFFPSETLRNRFLKALQPNIRMQVPPRSMLDHVICCCCGADSDELKYLPAPSPSEMFLPAPFYMASKSVCSECHEENKETSRREVLANVVNPKRKVGDGTCHSQMKMWTHALPPQSALPKNAAIDSYIRETKSRCIDSGVMLPAVRVDLVSIGKKKAKADKRGVDGRIENVYEWRRRAEANFVAEKFTVKGLGEGDEGGG